MIKKLLKIRNMTRFVRWLDQTNVHHAIRDTYFDMPWVMWPNERKSIERRLESTHQRDVFCMNRSKIRPKWRSIGRSMETRHGQYMKAKELLEYIKKRYARELKKKMERKREQKNIEKSVRESIRNTSS